MNHHLRTRALAMGALLLVLVPTVARAQDQPPALDGVTWLEGEGGDRFDVIVTGVSGGTAPTSVVMNARDADNYLEITISPDSLKLDRVFTGNRTTLGEAKLAAPLSDELSIEWRYDRVRVIADQTLAIETFEHGLVTGRSGYRGGIGGAEVILQPVDTVYFADDFGRLQANMGDWVGESGAWANVQSQGQAADSANPFAFEGRAAQADRLLAPPSQPGQPSLPVPAPPGSYALATTGARFWSDYWVDSAIRSEGATAIGLAGYCDTQSGSGGPAHFIAARWTGQTNLSEDGDKLQLIAVRGGERTVLAETPGGFAPEQWYRMKLAFSGRAVAVSIDGEEVLRTENTSGLAKGRIGLYGEGTGGARFDDTSAGPCDPGAARFPTDLTRWRTSPDIGPSPDGRGAGSITGKGGIAVLPEAFGNVRLNVKLAAAGDYGEVLFGYRGEQGHWALQWRGGTGGRLCVVRRSAGSEEVLATTPRQLAPDAGAELELLALDDYIRVRLNGETVIETADTHRLPLTEEEMEALAQGAPRPDGAVGVRFGPGKSPVVSSVAIALPQRPKAAVITEQFTRETGTMAEWATVAGAWTDPAVSGLGAPYWWNKGDLYGDTEVRVTLAGGSGTASVVIGATDYDATTGYMFKMTPSGSDLKVELLRRGGPLGEATATNATLPRELSFQRRGTLLTACRGRDVFLKVNDPDPLLGTKAGLLGEGVSIDYNGAYAFGMSQEDYTFSNAPTDWIEETGTWELSSRWTCSPQWSWWSGRSEEGALMWSKPGFASDVTVELYAAMKMGLADPSGRQYKHPDNINLVLCGDGTGIASGYSFIVGGAAASKTQIWKGAKLLAETDDPKAMLPRLANGMPNMNEFHRKWWQVRAEKQGGRLRLYLDNRLALEAADDSPLHGGHVGVWTWDNGIMIARAKVYGECTGDVQLPRVSHDYAVAANEPPPSPPSPVVQSATHPAIIQDFENGRGEFATFYREAPTGPATEKHGGAEQAAVLVLDTENARDGGGCLKLVNERPGGDFGAYAIVTDYQPRTFGWLSFDYRVGPDVKVDVVLRGGLGTYLITFTGSGAAPAGLTWLGRIPDVVADGKWHTAQFDIRAHMYDLGLDTTDTITETLIGNFSRDKMLGMGVTGNPKGATWWVDNFGVYSAGPAQGQFQWAAIQGAASYACAAVAEPTDDPGTAAVTTAQPTVSLAGLLSGRWYLQVTALDGDGQPIIRFAHPFVTVDGVPAVASTPPAGTDVPGGWVGLEVDNAGPGLLPDSIMVHIADRDLKLDSAGVRLDAVRNRVMVDLDRYVPPSEDDVSVQLALAAGSTYAGQPVTGGPFTFAVRRKLDVTPPPVPRIVETGEYLIDNDFEDGVGQWTPAGTIARGAAALSIDDTTSAGGASSLRLTKVSETGPFSAVAVAEPFDAGRHRLLSFDYKMAPWVRTDMVIETAADGKRRLLKMTDNDQDGGMSTLGQLPITADNAWHHVDIDLMDWLTNADPLLGDYRIASIVFRGGGWDGNPPGTTWNIDNFRIAGVASTRKRLILKWDAPDSSGISGASYVIDGSSDTEPDTVADTSSPALGIDPPVPDGWQWLHLRVEDGRGNWSAAAHHRIFLDGEGLTVSSFTVADQARVCTDSVRMTLSDGGSGAKSGVDPQSIKLRVGDGVYGVDGRVLTYSEKTGRLAWDGQAARPTPRTFADGENVLVSLESAQDYAGNPLGTPFSSTFTMDFSKDDSPPGRPYMRCPSHVTGFFEPYETNIGSSDQGLVGAKAEIDQGAVSAPGEDAVKRRLGTACLAITRTEGDAFGARILASSSGTNLADCPYLSFDYRCPPGTKVDFVFNIQGNKIAVTFTDGETQATRKVPGAIADDTWHHGELQLIDVARDVLGDQPAYSLRYVDLVDLGTVQTPVGGTIWMDNVWLTRGGQGRPQFEWHTQDPTGIAGYSWVFDRKPFTIPEATAMGTNPGVTLDRPEAGTWYLHVRAADGAGHWSDTSHLAIYEQP